MADQEALNPDEYIQSKLAQAPPQDDPQLQNLDPAAYLRQKEIDASKKNEELYGGAGQQALAGVEGLARGASLGTSDLLEQQLSKVLPEGWAPTAETIRGRKEANPITSFIGSGIGTGGLLTLTGGAAAPAEAGALAGGLSPLAARALGYGVEGTVIGAGNVVSDYALGDPSLNAQKILATLAGGAILGGGIGLFSKALSAVPALLRKGLGAARSEAEGLAPGPIVDAIGKKPTSLDQMRDMIKNAKDYGGQGTLSELETKPVVQAAADRLNPELQFPIHDYQTDALNNQEAWNSYRVTHEIPGEDGQAIRDYTLVQKKELTHVIDKSIQDLAPGHEITTDALEAGNRAAKSMSDVITKNREELGPAISAIKASPLAEVDHLPGVLDYLTDSNNPHGNPQIAKMFNTGGDKIQIKPYSSAMGIDESAYRAIKQAVGALEENPKDFEGLFNIREGLSQHIDLMKAGKGSSQITNAKAAMMDYIQDLVQKGEPNVQVRETFKRYAQNEQLAQTIEKKLGAEIGEGNFRSLAKGKPDEKILGNIFRDSETTKLVKEMLPPEQFQKIVADHLSILKNEATNEGVFSTRKFASLLDKNFYSMKEAIGSNPSLGKINDAVTLLKTFGDMTSINPSGTAKTMLGALSKISLTHPGEFFKAAYDVAKEKFGDAQLAHQINAKLAGESAKATQLSSIQSMLKKVTNQIGSEAKEIFSNPTAQRAIRGAALGAASQLSDEKYKEITDHIKKMVGNPQTMMDHMSDNTSGLYAAAPNITQSLNQSAMQSLGFLNSKIPQAPNPMLLSPVWKPSPTQKAKFSRYYHAVSQPLEALKQVKSGTLTSETMESLQAVHPQLLEEMRQKVLEHLKPEKAMKLTYSKKVALSKFLGQPLDQNMVPQSIMANQATFSSPQLGDQAGAKQGRKTNQGGLKQLKFATRSQPMSDRRGE